VRAIGDDPHARVLACDAGGCINGWKWSDSADAAPCTSFETGGAADVATLDDAGARIVVGGRDREFALWDTASGQCTWNARNVPHDNLDVPVPVWHTGAQFLPDKVNTLVTCTGYVQSRLRGEVRLYDVSAKRRPLLRSLAPVGDEALRCITCTPDGRYVLAGSGSGHMAKLDLRKNLQPVHRYKGAAGSIRQIVVHPTLPLVASASLDRHVRLYRLDGTGALLRKVYLKQRLSALMLSAERPHKNAFEAPGAKSTKSADVDEVDEDEDEGDDVGALLGALPEAEGGNGFDDEPAEEEEDDEDDDGGEELDGFGGRSGDSGSDDDNDDDDDDDDVDEEASEDEAPPARVGSKRKAEGGRTATKKK